MALNGINTAEEDVASQLSNSPMAVSGMAKSVFSVHTRNAPCTDIPTP